MNIHLMDGENADQLLTRILTTCRAEHPNTLTVNEFDDAKSYDINGSKITNNSIVLGAKIIKKLLSKDVREMAFLLAKLEDVIGATLCPPSIERKDVKRRSAEAITTRIAKYERRRVYEIKRLANLNPEVVESQNADTVSSLETLNRLKEADDNSIYAAYVVIFNMSKRDELFYMRRHPKAVMLHRTLDFDLVANLREAKWLMGVSVD